MGIISRIKSIFKKKPGVPQTGTIFIKPSEKKSVPTPPPGLTISVPATGETRTSSSGGYVRTSTPASKPMDVISSSRRNSSPQVVSKSVSESLQGITPSQSKAQAQSQAKVDRYAKSQEAFYTAQVNRAINKISNFRNLRLGLQQAIYKREYDKANKSYLKSVGGYADDLSKVKIVPTPPSPKKPPINIFSKQSWIDFGKALVKSKSQRDRNLGQKILTEPLLFTSRFVSSSLNIYQLPAALLALIKSPSNIKKIPGNLIDDFKGTAKLLKTSPNEGLGKIGADIFTFRIIGGAIKPIGLVTSKVATKLSPKFAKIRGNVITIPSKQTGKFLNIKIGGSVKKLAEPLKIQVELAGKKVTAVSAQADRLVKLLRTQRVVRKPIPNEAKLSTRTKALLKKFDKGKITKQQLISLDRRIRRETGRAGNLLERSFWADPRGRLRPSRLGIQQKEATLSDLFKGKATFKSSKPQVLIFEDIVIQKFPKTKIFNTIKRKLKTGKTLTRGEANSLMQFQLKKSGKFKPLGHLTREPEILLSPGEIIKKVKTIAVTLIDGRRVPIVRAKVVKAKPITTKLLKKAEKGTITTKELKRLRTNLKRETGFEPSLSRGRTGKLRYPLARKGTALSSSLIRRRPSKRRLPKRIPGIKRRPKPRARKPTRIPARKRLPKRPPVRPPGRPARKPSPRVAGRPAPRRRLMPRPGAPPLKPLIKPPRVKKIKKKKKPKRKQAYEVYARPLKRTKKGKRPKLVKVSKVPLTKKKAKNLRNFIVDQSLGRTARIKPIRGKPTAPKLKVPPGYAKKTSAKFRRWKQRKGKRIPLPKGKVIELGRHLLDTKFERKKIGLLRRIKMLEKTSRFKPTKKNPVRVSTTSQYITNQRLKNLKKARAVRQKNLKFNKKSFTKTKTLLGTKTPIRSKGKRTLSQAQLNALARGRATRMRNLARRRR